MSDFKKEWKTMHDTDVYLRAVIVVYRQMHNSGDEPGAEVWSTNRPFFLSHAMPLIREYWSSETGLRKEQFPWDIESVVYTWISWRKSLQNKKDDTLKELGIESPLTST